MLLITGEILIYYCKTGVIISTIKANVTNCEGCYLEGNEFQIELIRPDGILQ